MMRKWRIVAQAARQGMFSHSSMYEYALIHSSFHFSVRSSR